MRLFVGITPTAEAISHAAGEVDRIASTTPDVRWIPSQRWHVTLAFLGDVDADLVPALATHLDEVAASHAPIEALALTGSGTFPGVLWLGIADAARPSESAPGRRFSPEVRLGGLAEDVQRAMPLAGIHLESRPWRPHLTIGRWRPSPRREGAARAAARALAGYAGPAFDVHEIRLVQSITGPAPTYRDLHVASLTGTSAQGAGTT